MSDRNYHCPPVYGGSSYGSNRACHSCHRVLPNYKLQQDGYLRRHARHMDQSSSLYQRYIVRRILSVQLESRYA
jgi:phosphopantetheinyl transferase